MKYSIQSFLITFVCALIIFGVTAMILWNSFGQSLIPEFGGTSDTPEDNVTENNEDPDNLPDVNPDNADPEKEIVGESFTVLLNGYDDLHGVIDAAVLLRVDKEKKQVVVASVNTQTPVYIGHTQTSDQLVVLGNLVKFKNISYTIEKIYSITGLHADYYINVNMSDFAKVIDTLYSSGYKYTVPVSMEYSDPEQELEINFTKGQVISSGEDIIKALRYREDGNERRMSRQRDFIASFLMRAIPDKISLADTSSAINTFKKVAGIVDTNIPSDFVASNIELIAAIDEFRFVFVADGSVSQYIKYR